MKRESAFAVGYPDIERFGATGKLTGNLIEFPPGVGQRLKRDAA